MDLIGSIALFEVVAPLALVMGALAVFARRSRSH